ncbi:hypothetical protein C5B92_10955 [Rathayibacter sp. AY1A4]|nr:hypothetical protein C5B92_10955 [Rathayibacter sp. AY1A4]
MAMTDYLPRVWICVVYACCCAFLALAFLASAVLGRWLSLAWAALAIGGVVLFVRRAQRLHRTNRQQ